jgi:uridine kinase
LPPVATEVWGVCGASGSGKTTFALRLAGRLSPHCVSVLPLDSYYVDLSHLEPKARSQVNFDHPDSLDVALFSAHLDALHAGHAIDAPGYDFITNNRTGETCRVEPRPLVITEGILLLAAEEIRSRLDYTIFLEVPDEICLHRRLERDVRERGRHQADVRRQYAETVRPMFELHAAHRAPQCDRVVRFGEDRDAVIEELASRVVVS